MPHPTIFFLATLCAAVSILAAPDSSYGLIGIWGRNLAKSQSWETADQEPPLATLCQTTNYSIYHLSYIYAHFDATKLSGLDLDLHCQWPTNKFPGYPNPPSSHQFNVLNCPDVGRDIGVCQGLGKKIVISLAPMDFLTSADDAALSAENVWNLFLGGSSQYRPFGNSVVLDGVDLHVWNNDPKPEFYTTFVSRLRELMNGNSSKQYTLSGSSLCQYPDVLLGGSNRPNTPLYDNPALFDYLISYFVTSPNICGWGGNNGGFWQKIKEWSDFITAATPNTRLYVGLPSWYTPEFAQASSGDYISPDEIYSGNVVPRMKEVSNFAGFALQDVSFDVLNKPCGNDPKMIYSAVLYQQLTSDVTIAGNATPADQRCEAPTATSSGSNSPTSTPRPQPTGNSSAGCEFWGTCEDKNTTTNNAHVKGGTVVAIFLPLLVIVVVAAIV